MANSKNITATKSRLMDNLTKITTAVIDSKVPKQISEAVDKETIRTGVLTKFYPYLDKAEVQLVYNEKKVLCKILHRYGGDITDFYTPVADTRDYDEKLHEPYIVPKARHSVCVLNINDKDSEENLILGYYQNSDIVEYNPASPGNIKVFLMVEDNQFWIKFGVDGFDYRLPSTPTMKIGKNNKIMEDVDYAQSDMTYTKQEIDDLFVENSNIEFYTKEELDNKFNEYEERINELEEIIQSMRDN